MKKDHVKSGSISFPKIQLNNISRIEQIQNQEENDLQVINEFQMQNQDTIIILFQQKDSIISFRNSESELDKEKQIRDIKYYCENKKKQVKNTINKLKMLQENKEQKLKARLSMVNKRREAEQQQRIEKINKRSDLLKLRQEQQKQDQLMKIQQKSIKDIFIERKRRRLMREEIENFQRRASAPKYESYGHLPQQEDVFQQQQQQTNYRPSLAGLNFFSLTAPDDFHEIRTKKSNTSFHHFNQNNQNSKKPRKTQLAPLPNPFDKKEIWHQIYQAAEKGDIMEWPGIGIKQTPIYKINLEDAEKNRKKLDILKRIQRGDFVHVKKRNLHFKNIYDSVKDVYSLVSQKPSDMAQNAEERKQTFLDRGLQRAIYDSQVVWGGGMSSNDMGLIQRVKQMGDMNGSINSDLLEDSVVSRPNKNYMFTKLAVKVKLE